MVLEDISNAGYRPIIAHPERYHAIRQNPGRIRSWVRRGYIIQVNKGSVLGTFGPGVRAAARQLLNMGFVHVLASDAHSAQRRTTDLRSLRKYLLERYPPGYIRLLLEENPGRLVRGEQMAPMNNF
jgi:protein-tyrosine phosphatase